MPASKKLEWRTCTFLPDLTRCIEIASYTYEAQEKAYTQWTDVAIYLAEDNSTRKTFFRSIKRGHEVKWEAAVLR